MSGCVFCGYNDYTRIVDDLGRVLVIDPLNPITPGHLLFVPREHIENATESPPLAGLAPRKQRNGLHVRGVARATSSRRSVAKRARP